MFLKCAESNCDTAVEICKLRCVCVCVFHWLLFHWYMTLALYEVLIFFAFGCDGVDTISTCDSSSSISDISDSEL